MTDEQFCKILTAYDGEKISHVDQLVQETFTGRELKDIIDFFILSQPCVHPREFITGTKVNMPHCRKCDTKFY